MRRINIYRIDAQDVVSVYICQCEWIEKLADREIEAKNLVPGGREKCVTGGKVVCQRSAEAGDASPVVETTLSVQFDSAIVLEMD